MKIFKRIKFAVKYDFGGDFIVVPWDVGEAGASKFLDYDEAIAFANKTPMDRVPPLVFVSVRKVKP